MNFITRVVIYVTAAIVVATAGSLTTLYVFDDPIIGVLVGFLLGMFLGSIAMFFAFEHHESRGKI